MLYCFLDTNIFHEFKPITEIDWVNELGASKVCLVVTSIVVKELDKHKGGNNRRLKKKARKWTAFLENLDVGTDNEIRQNVTLRLDLSEPTDDTFNEYNLSASVADDRLLAKAIECAAQHTADKVAVVSDDSAVRLKARGYRLCVPTLTEENRLEHEPDPVMQELNELRIENTRLQNTQPKLQLGFRDSTGTLVNFLKASNDFSKSLISESELEDLLQTERDKSQYVPIAQTIDNDQLPVFSTLGTFRKTVTNSQIDEYYRNVDDFLERYREYLVDISLARVFPHRSILLNLVLMNEGSIPAQNVEIRLDVEGSSKVLLQVPEAPPYEPSPPAKPEPRSLFDFGAYDRNLLSYLGHGIHGNNIDLGPPWEEWTREEDSSGLSWYEYGIKKIQHHRSRDMEPLYLYLNECDKFPVTVSVKYEVTADNLVDMLTGDLTVIVNQSAP